MSYIAVIDESSCLAHGDCAELAPDVFVLEDVARVIGTGPHELLLATAEACPATAISVTDEQTGEAVYP
jgi:ferredoxin